MQKQLKSWEMVFRGWGIVCATALVLPHPAWADDFTDALVGGKVSGDIRMRYESVSDDSLDASVTPAQKLKDADALTVRTRLGYETAAFMGFSVMAEFEDTRTLFGVDSYAPESSHTPAYATIADPSVTELNRAFLRYSGVSKLDLAYGRQRIIYDNARFIGNVGWRQDEQTFDGFTAVYKGLPDFTLNYAYLTQVNGILSTFDAENIADNLFNVSYSGFAWGKFTTYAYLLDHDDETDPSVNGSLRFKTNDTYGLRFDGDYPVAKSTKLLYTAEYAKQSFEKQSGDDYDTDYKFLELGASYDMPAVVLMGKLAYEQLGSDSGNLGFQTPFATKHAFNGWADKFLATPADGLEDRFATFGVTFKPQKIKVLAVYHTFDAAEGSNDYGSEWDLLLSKAYGKHYVTGIKYASYSGKDVYADTDKLWVWGEVKF